MTRPTLTALDHLVITATDITATARFYVTVLGMRHDRFTDAAGKQREALFFGARKINLHAADAPFAPHAAVPAPGSADLCFLTETPLADWQVHLATMGVEIEEGPVARTGASGSITSLYIRDPDGALIEIATRS